MMSCERTVPWHYGVMLSGLSSFHGERTLDPALFPARVGRNARARDCLRESNFHGFSDSVCYNIFLLHSMERPTSLAKLSSPTPSERELSTCVDRGSGTVLLRR